jgi:hypothetical protein
MFRLALLVFGVVEALFPRRVVDAFTRLGYEHPDEFEPKPWLVSAARVEGVLLALAALVGIVAGKLASRRGSDADASVDESTEN